MKHAMLLALVTLSILFVSGCTKTYDTSNACLEYEGDEFLECTKVLIAEQESYQKAAAEGRCESLVGDARLKCTDYYYFMNGLCDNREDSALANSCWEEYYKNVSVANRDFRLCLELEQKIRFADGVDSDLVYIATFVDQCLVNYAAETGDADACLSMQEPLAQYGVGLKADCLTDAAVASGDIETCRLIDPGLEFYDLRAEVRRNATEFCIEEVSSGL